MFYLFSSSQYSENDRLKTTTKVDKCHKGNAHLSMPKAKIQMKTAENLMRDRASLLLKLRHLIVSAPTQKARSLCDEIFVTMARFLLL
jgi:hypothetical protein